MKNGSSPDDMANASDPSSHWRDPAALMLGYAWSECDESVNCLMPTYAIP